MSSEKRTHLKRLFYKADSTGTGYQEIRVSGYQGIRVSGSRMPNIAANKVSRESVMTTHSRETKVLVVLGASITLGAIILNALGHNPPSAGAFCLSRYYRLGPVKESILSRAAQSQERWSQVEIYYSGTESGNIEYLASLNDVGSPPVREQNEKVSNEVNCHFVICNGNGGSDGQIQTTEKWQRQSPVLALVGAAGETLTEQTIYICVIANGETVPPTDFQRKRTEALVEELCRKFDIQLESIRYPDNRR